jgi:hypothetical protein
MERNTLAGDQACYTKYTACSSTPCISQYWACDSWFQPGNFYLSLSSDTQANFTIDTLLFTPVPLDLNGTNTGFVLPGQYDHYSISVPQDILSYLEEFVVTVQVEAGGEVIGFLNFGSLAGDSSSTCLTSTEQGTSSKTTGQLQLTQGLCGQAGIYYVGIFGAGGNTSSYSIGVSIAESVPAGKWKKIPMLFLLIQS